MTWSVAFRLRRYLRESRGWSRFVGLRLARVHAADDETSDAHVETAEY